MTSDDFDQQVSSLAALGEPIRRQLYRYVVAQPEPVSRENAAANVGVAHHVAKFHLDKLEEDGLLDAEYRRPPGRSGPGAGRPTKLYRRAARQIAVSLPERRYDLAGHILAEAVTTARRTGRAIDSAVAEAARAAGRALGERARQRGQQEDATQEAHQRALDARAPHEEATEDARQRGVLSERAHQGAAHQDAAHQDAAWQDAAAGGRQRGRGDSPPADQLDTVGRALAANGYEPRLGPGRITLANCPFHDLAENHTALVCGLNLDLINGLLDALPVNGLRAALDPAPGRCCVAVDILPARRPRR